MLDLEAILLNQSVVVPEIDVLEFQLVNFRLQKLIVNDVFDIALQRFDNTMHVRAGCFSSNVLTQLADNTDTDPFGRHGVGRHDVLFPCLFVKFERAFFHVRDQRLVIEFATLRLIKYHAPVLVRGTFKTIIQEFCNFLFGTVFPFPRKRNQSRGNAIVLEEGQVVVPLSEHPDQIRVVEAPYRQLRSMRVACESEEDLTRAGKGLDDVSGRTSSGTPEGLRARDSQSDCGPCTDLGSAASAWLESTYKLSAN